MTERELLLAEAEWRVALETPGYTTDDLLRVAEAHYEELVAEAKRMRLALELSAQMWEHAADDAERDHELSTLVAWFRTQASNVRQLVQGDDFAWIDRLAKDIALDPKACGDITRSSALAITNRVRTALGLSELRSLADRQP